MKILEYKYNDEVWDFQKICFGDINLIVGDSGSGKTRLLNTIFNFGSNVAQSKLRGVSAWSTVLEVNGDQYHWDVSTTKKDNVVIVEREKLLLNGKVILERNTDEFVFGDAPPLPKLPKNIFSVSILREEEIIKPLYDGFTQILRRKFFEDALVKNSSIYAVSRQSLENIGNKQDLNELFTQELGLNPKLYILSKFFPEIYDEIISQFQDIFEFVSDVAILDSSTFDLVNIPGRAPLFCIKEQNVDKWIRLDEFSSGMQKVLLILTDLLTLPDSSIYLSDEYENSLGIGAINFLPELLFSKNLNAQILMTSHHPYIIGKIPVENWYVVHRNGSNVNFTFGEELIERYGVSSHEKYLQLINDPIYGEGIS